MASELYTHLANSIDLDEEKHAGDLSWWPKDNVFRTCGLWTGYWSPACENWYQTRLAAIRRAAAGHPAADGYWAPKTSKKWYDALKYEKTKTKAYLGGNDQASVAYLSTIRSLPLRAASSASSLQYN